jgi:hypothetical protein
MTLLDTQKTKMMIEMQAIKGVLKMEMSMLPGIGQKTMLVVLFQRH